MIEIHELQRDVKEKPKVYYGREFYSSYITVGDALYNEEPLLDYVKELVHLEFDNYFIGLVDCYDSVPIQKLPSFHAIFASRYVRNIVQMPKESKEQYVNDYSLLSTLLAYGLDPEKVWYMLLWVKDYVDSCDSGPMYHDTPIKELKTFLDYIEPMFPPEDLDHHFPLELGKITVKVGKKNKIDISNPTTIKILRRIIQNYINTYSHTECEQYFELNSSGEVYEQAIDWDDICSIWNTPTKSVKATPRDKRYLSYSLLKRFFDAKKVVNTCKYVEDFFPEANMRGYGVDIGKSWLISRLICIMGLAERMQYYDNSHKKKMHDDLKGMNMQDLQKRGLHSTIYTI